MLRSSCTTVLRDAGAVQRLEQCFGRMKNLSLQSTTTKTTSSRFLSSAPPKPAEANSSDEQEPPPKQPFVTAHLEPGEWNRARTDPYFRPKPPRMSKLISAEDFANRNPVAFEGDFETYGDAMISLSWLEERTCRQMYQLYMDMMVLSQDKHQKNVSRIRLPSDRPKVQYQCRPRCGRRATAARRRANEATQTGTLV
mmetsp:Transcript_78046/g.117448  ORF Transcript_78046/g.117448 Transcript_78046/m.117448 type:complete len:197 (-) Transcript_78046:952-1542(-)